MKKNELIKLRNGYNKELEKVNRINELLKSDIVKEFVKLSGIDISTLNKADSYKILRTILQQLKITNTNGIYVCTGAFYTDCDIEYQETNYYTKKTSLDSPLTHYRTYRDIESETDETAYTKPCYFPKKNGEYFLTTIFEREHIILNPTNFNDYDNGYYQVRQEFFKNAIDFGQAKSKKLLLEKYPRIGY